MIYIGGKLIDKTTIEAPVYIPEPQGRVIDTDKLFSDEKIRYDIPWYEEVYASGYKTNGNYWWIGTMSGYHEIKL